jgi:amino acid transporter
VTPRGLRRELGFLGATALAVGVMAPTLAMSITGVAAAGQVGRAAPVAYVLAAVGVGLVASGFVLLSSRYAHAGSVYAFAGHALGPRAGFLMGWALLGTYIVFPPVSMLGIGIFGQAFLESAGIAASPPWLPIALVGWAVIWVLAARGIRVTTRSLLAFEGVSLLLILALVAVIFFKLGAGTAPRGQGLSLDIFSVPDGTTIGAVALAVTFGFLSYAGFESSGSLGEETRAPTRVIPRSILLSVALGGVLYTVCIAAQTLGFGVDAAGVHAFTASGAPLNDLGRSYVGSGMAELLDVGATISAFGAGLGGVAVGSRMLFALARDGLVIRRLSGVSEGTGAPAPALAAIMGFGLVALLAFGVAGTRPLDAFFYLATIGVLSLLVMYIVTNVGAIRVAAADRDARRWWAVALPAAGILVAGYTLFKHLSPVPDSPYDIFPYVVGGWLAVGLTISLAIPGFSARVAERLGLAAAQSNPSARARATASERVEAESLR